ncbi:MAG: WYL domain-containing protein [Planctomycetota bacterium]
MNIKRVTRLLKVLQMLQARAGENADGLAHANGVSRRTVFRDIESLKAAGVPVAYDRETDRYSLPGAYLLPPTNFSAQEAMAIICLTTQLGRRDSLPFYEPARRAAQKLEASLPGDLRQQIQELTRAVHVRPRQINQLESKDDVYQQLVDAQATREEVWIEYDSLTEWERIETVLRPYQLMFARRSWYVVGRSSLHKEVRTFNIDRVASLRRLGETFRLPRGFSLAKYLGNAWRMIPEPGPDVEVHLHFKHMVARNVEEVHWHAEQRTERRADGSLDFWVTVSGVTEISWWVLQYGDQVEVLAPDRLRTLIANRITEMAKIYARGVPTR